MSTLPNFYILGFYTIPAVLYIYLRFWAKRKMLSMNKGTACSLTSRKYSAIVGARLSQFCEMSLDIKVFHESPIWSKKPCSYPVLVLTTWHHGLWMDGKWRYGSQHLEDVWDPWKTPRRYRRRKEWDGKHPEQRQKASMWRVRRNESRAKALIIPFMDGEKKKAFLSKNRAINGDNI